MKKIVSLVLAMSLLMVFSAFIISAEDIPYSDFEGPNLSGYVTGEDGGVVVRIMGGTGDIPIYIKAGELAGMISEGIDQKHFQDYLLSLGDVYIPVTFINIDSTPRHPDTVRVYVDSNPVYFDQIPQIEEGRILLPLRGVFEALGAKVEWDAATNTVTAERNGITVSLTVGSDKMIVNGKEVTLDVPAKITGGRTFIPLRAIGEAFGLKVEWDQYTRGASIFSE